MSDRIHGSEHLDALSREWLVEATRARYAHNFTWLGRPVVQLPQDLIAMQEIVYRVRPDLIVETGIAQGGSLIFYASLLELCAIDEGRVVGIDVDIRAHNRVAIEAHPMNRRITMLEGSSTDPAVVERVRALAADRARVLVALDSNHTHAHVLAELELYAPLVRAGSYLVVFDTAVADVPKDLFPDRPWGPGDNPRTAVQEFLRRNTRFEVDRAIDQRLSLTVAPGGYLRCVAD